MKTVPVLLACGAALLLGVAAQAQTDSPTPASSPSAPFAGPRHPGEGPLARLTQVLELSGTQREQVAQILEAARPQMQAIQEQRKALIESVASQITPILNPEQQAKFAKMLNRIENGPRAGGGKRFANFTPGAAPSPGGGAEPGAAGNAGRGAGKGDVLQRLTSQLGLTPEQQSQVQSILANTHTQLVSIRQNTSLTEDEKFAQVKQTMESTHSQINSVLTPAQQEEFASLRRKFQPNHANQPAPAASPSPAAQ